MQEKNCSINSQLIKTVTIVLLTQNLASHQGCYILGYLTYLIFIFFALWAYILLQILHIYYKRMSQICALHCISIIHLKSLLYLEWFQSYERKCKHPRPPIGQHVPFQVPEVLNVIICHTHHSCLCLPRTLIGQRVFGSFGSQIYWIIPRLINDIDTLVKISLKHFNKH